MLSKFNISDGKKKILIYIVLTLATLAVYWQVHVFGFINIDDQAYITENSHIQSGLSLDGIHWAFSTRYADLWNPIVWLSFMLDYQFYGLNAGGYHITNLILHILSVLMLFWLFNRMTKKIWPSAFIAAVFALHPLHVESVAWIAERKDVLSAFFWMLTLCLYAYYTGKPVIKRYLLVLISFFCALMSKPMVVTLPAIMILLDYWPLKRFEPQKSKSDLILWQLKEKAPLFILSAIIIIVTFFNPDKMGTPLQAFPLSSRLANAPVSFVTYLEKTFWPNDMAIFYPFPAHIPAWQVTGALVLILVITAFVISMTKRQPYLFVGWLWYSITILPVIKIVQIGSDAMADRYHYLPSIGISVMVAWGILSLIKNEFVRRNILFPSAIIVVVLMAVLTWQQCGYWKNSIELWSHALKVTKNNAMAHSNYASALYEEGNIDEALNHYNKAINLKPDKEDGSFYNSRGAIYHRKNQYQLAINDYNKAIDLNAANYRAYNNRGLVYVTIGRLEPALEDFNKAIFYKPDFADAYDNRTFIYYKQGNKVSCCNSAKKACELGKCENWEALVSEGFCH
jgi:protein O-mannosyl-transferase